MFKYLYIDESGDLGFRNGSSRFLIISALMVENPKDLDRIIKNVRRNRFRKELKKANEIKANKSSPELIIYLLKKLNSVRGAKIFHIVLEKSRVFSNYLKEDKHKLYNFIAGKLARNILIDEVQLEIKIDKSKGSLFLQEDFNHYFEARLIEGCNNIRCKIDHSYSHSWSGLQFADIIVWACLQKFEHNNNKFIDLITLEQEVYQLWTKQK